jgi:eukaryotic-like serine/threonine-protein kinase
MDRRKFLYGSGTAVGGGLLGTYALAREASTQEMPANEQAPAQLQQLEGGWPKFRYDLANTGHAPTETGPDAPVAARWAAEVGGWADSPVVVDDTVYFGTTHGDNSVYALDSTDGSQQWRFATGGYVSSTPAVADGTVYVGSQDDHMYALDAGTGTEQWRFEADGRIFSSPAVADGTVYIGSGWGDFAVYALDAADGTVQWRFETGGEVGSSPAVVDGTVYVGSDDGYMYALDATDGTEEWTTEIGDFETRGIHSTPAVVDGTVYFGGGWDFSVYALDAATGAVQWRFEADGPVNSSPAVADGTVYIGSREWDDPGGYLYALDAATGDEQWTFETDWEIYSSPAVVDDTVYVGSEDSNVYALDAADGTVQWRFETEFGIYSSPAVTDGTVYIGGIYGTVGSGTMYAIEHDPADPSASITFTDQESDGLSVVIQEVELSHGGYVEVTDADGTVRGRSATLSAGPHEAVEVAVSPPLDETQELTATVYQPSGEPYLADGEPVSDTALITVVEPVEPTASITFEDQESNGSAVVIQEVELSHGGYVEVTDEDGAVLGRSEALAAGTHQNVQVTITPPLADTQGLTATVYRDINAPYFEDGNPVSDTALITLIAPDEPTASITFADQESDGSSVVIDQVELSHGGYVEITDADGTGRGRSTSLEAGAYEDLEVTLSPVLEETQELTATVYQPNDDPYLGPDEEPVSDTALITVPDPVEPTASITFEDQESTGEAVVIDQVELSHGGFVELTDEDDTVRGQSEELPAGTHQNVLVQLAPALEETQELTATVYRDVDTPYLENGSPVSDTALITVVEPDELTASITFVDQESDGSSVVVDQIELSHGGYVEITDEAGVVRGQSEILAAGTYENLEVTLSPPLGTTQELTATVDQLSGDPYLEPDGEPVSDTALISVVEPAVPTASIAFEDQESDGSAVVIRQVDLSHGGFVEVTDARGVVRGQTADLDAGTYENVEVALTPPLVETQQLTATVYRDIDVPYLEDGEPVSATALITVHPDEKPPKKKKKKRRKKKRAVKRTKREYKKAKKQFEKGRLTKKELKKKRDAYERAKREYEEYKKRCR